jgi:glutaredoxin
VHARVLPRFLHGVGLQLPVSRRHLRYRWKTNQFDSLLALAIPSGLLGFVRRSRHDRVRASNYAMSMPAVTLYTRVGCHLCDVAKDVLDEVRRVRPFELTTIDVDSDTELREKYGYEVPVVTIDGRKAFKLRVDAEALRARLGEVLWRR